MSNNIASIYPELASLWDKEHNEIMPNSVSLGSHLEVYWRCSTCGYSYTRKVQNQVKIYRQRGLFNICPNCRGKRVVPEYNSLKARHPDIVEAEWDYEKNSVEPDKIAPHANRTVWWRCINGHSYSSSPNNKLNGGGDCPYCSHHKVSPETSLLATYPEIAKEWHPTLNNCGPEDILPQSNEDVWWKCSICGNEFHKKVCQRIKSPFGCKKCNKGRQTSISEQLVYNFLTQYFPDAINTYKIDRYTDIDIYLPSINVGIEYDGARYHKSKLDKDIAKTKRIISNGIVLIRIREKGCPQISITGCICIETDDNLISLESKLPILLETISQITNTQFALKDFDFQSILRKLKSEFSTVPYDKSLEAYIDNLQHEGKSLVALWDSDNNGALIPRHVTPQSAIEVYWLCPNDTSHKGWRAPIHSVVNGYGCKICSNRQRYTTEEWIMKARKIHEDRYDYSQSKYVDASTPIDIICSIHGAFSQPAGQHLTGRGCPYCAGQAFHSADSITLAYPELAKEWDLEMNLSEYNVTPDKVSFHDCREFFWHCNFGKPHSYKATLWSRIKRDLKCAVCHGKQVAYDTSLAYLNPKLASEWCEENDKTPEEVTPKSDYVALWKCPNPHHPPYRQKVEVRSRGTGCVYCARRGKKHPKDYENELFIQHPYIKLLKPFTKTSVRVECKCEICGHTWMPFPYNLIKS
ncbi:zinc-ribbon domain-containing protein [uncultured Duncaniella sp.]|nr:zinc-ribbon domain-containing protein [uncultured Duncaniella sp.]